MAPPLHQLLLGSLLLAGFAPDGDSIRFIADDPRRYRGLEHANRLRVSANGSAQVRFQAIDAPELHYEGAGQPLGRHARALLLGWCGFSAVRYEDDGKTVRSAEPAKMDATLVTSGIDPHGRPIGYLLRGHLRDAPRELSAERIDGELLSRTANHAMLACGAAYLLAYTSLPRTHHAFFRETALTARSHRAGVWSHDRSSTGFALADLESIGPNGALVFPKLFRRCVDYLASRKKGFRGGLRSWLAAHVNEGARPSEIAGGENDGVRMLGTAAVPLSGLIAEHAGRVALQADTLDAVFVEK